MALYEVHRDLLYNLRLSSWLLLKHITLPYDYHFAAKKICLTVDSHQFTGLLIYRVIYHEKHYRVAVLGDLFDAGIALYILGYGLA